MGRPLRPLGHVIFSVYFCCAGLFDIEIHCLAFKPNSRFKKTYKSSCNPEALNLILPSKKSNFWGKKSKHLPKYA